MYFKKRRIDRHFLRSDGKPNFSDRIYKTEFVLDIVSRKPVVTLSQRAPVSEAVKRILKYGFRRLPITMPNRKLIGIVTATDLVNFFGGGDFFKIILDRHDGSLYSSLEEPVESLMNRNVIYSKISEDFSMVLEKMILNNVGAVVMVDDEERVSGIITERDILRYMSEKLVTRCVDDIMTRDVVTASPNMTLREAAQAMIELGFRRLPVLDDNGLVGIVVATDLLRQFTIQNALKYSPRGSVYDVLRVPLHLFMIRDVYTTARDAEIGDVAKFMMSKNVGALPVVEDGSLVGIITERDILYDIVLAHYR